MMSAASLPGSLRGARAKAAAEAAAASSSSAAAAASAHAVSVDDAAVILIAAEDTESTGSPELRRVVVSVREPQEPNGSRRKASSLP